MAAHLVLASSHYVRSSAVIWPKATVCIYIVGRNAEAAKKIISDCTAKCPEGQYRFIQAMDLSLLQNVDKVAAEIIQHQQQNTSDSSGPRVDMLFMTQGGLYLTPRQGTLALLEDILTLLVAVTDLQSYRDTRRSRLRHVNALLLPRAFHFPAAPCCSRRHSHHTWYRSLRPATKRSSSVTTCLCVKPAITAFQTLDLTAPL